MLAAWRSDNFVVGLTNVSPQVQAPVLWHYTVCGQYSGAVSAAETVDLMCTNDLKPYIYLIIQVISDCFNACEIEVFLGGKCFPKFVELYSALCEHQMFIVNSEIPFELRFWCIAWTSLIIYSLKLWGLPVKQLLIVVWKWGENNCIKIQTQPNKVVYEGRSSSVSVVKKNLTVETEGR